MNNYLIFDGNCEYLDYPLYIRQRLVLHHPMNKGL